MQAAEQELTVRFEQGLHARPAARFVQLAAQYQSDITLTTGSRSASAKGILGVLSLGIRKGAAIRLRAVGADAEAAMAALTAFLSDPAVD